jgi:quercetin dioxygenase-like cupin family protein
MADRYEDERGVIRDILPFRIDCITEIFTRAGAVRGNHVHEKTTQWTYIVSGRLLMALLLGDELHQAEHGPGELVAENPGAPHAWKALEDTTVLVFTSGPRSGEGYESDTRRLEVPILT